MVIYIINSIIPLLAIIISSSNRSSRKNINREGRDTIIFILMIIWFSVIATFENVWGVTGVDYERYRYHTLVAVNKSWDEIFNIFFKHPITGEAGAVFIDKVAGSIINNYDIYRLCLTLFIVFSYFTFFKRNSPNWLYACWMWIVWGNYRFINNTTFQMLSSAIVLLIGSKYIASKNFVKYGIVCLIATLFHASSIMYIIYYFVFSYDWKKTGRIIIYIISILFIFFAQDFISSVSLILYQYSNFATYGSWYSWKVLLAPVLVTVVIALTIYHLRLRQKYPTGIWTQTLLAWIVFYSLTIINGIAIRFTYIPEAYSLDIFSTCMYEYKSRNKIFVYFGTLVACIMITIYLR